MPQVQQLASAEQEAESLAHTYGLQKVARCRESAGKPASNLDCEGERTCRHLVSVPRLDKVEVALSSGARAEAPIDGGRDSLNLKAADVLGFPVLLDLHG